MASYPVEIRRCRHVKTSGTQCGSPALKDKELCYFHEQNHPEPVEFYLGDEPGCASRNVLPVFEDAHSIQSVIRLVVQLLLAQKIHRKDAGLMLYALQIASGNLKAMMAEKAKPTQVVVEPEKATGTPLGMTPWSASGRGHDPEDGEDVEEEGREDAEEEDGEGEVRDVPAPAPTAEALYFGPTLEEISTIREKWDKGELFGPDEIEKNFLFDGPVPLLITVRRVGAERDAKRPCEFPHSQTPDGQGLPPGTIQACQAWSARAEFPCLGNHETWGRTGSPTIYAAGESHPNVEKHDVRMGHPAALAENRGQGVFPGSGTFYNGFTLS